MEIDDYGRTYGVYDNIFSEPLDAVVNFICYIKNLIIERSKDLDVLHLDWFGGEPLLAIDIIHYLMSFAIQCSYENGFALKSGMTTNASLFTKSRQEQLIRVGTTDYQVRGQFSGDRNELACPYAYKQMEIK